MSMKPLTAPVLALLAAAMPTAAMAAFQGPTATTGVANMTVEKALSLRFDRERVCLTGNIVNKLPFDDDKYTFQDMTGSMMVDIDHHLFGDENVTPQTRVRICGEVEAEAFKPNEFDAESLELLYQ